MNKTNDLKKLKALRTSLASLSLVATMSLTGCVGNKEVKKTNNEKNYTKEYNNEVKSEAETFYDKYSEFFNDEYDNYTNPKEEAVKDIDNVINMIQNKYKNISDEDLRRAFRLIQDCQMPIELLQSAYNYKANIENEVIVPTLPNLSEFVLDDTVREELNEGYNKIDELRVALNNRDKLSTDNAINNLQNYVIDIEFYYTQDKSNTGEIASQATAEYLILDNNLAAENLLTPFTNEGTIVFNDTKNNNPNQTLKIAPNQFEDQIISAFETRYLDERPFDVQEIETIDENNNKIKKEVKGIDIVFFDGTHKFVTIEEYENLKDIITTSKLKDKMYHIENDMAKEICPSVVEEKIISYNVITKKLSI